MPDVQPTDPNAAPSPTSATGLPGLDLNGLLRQALPTGSTSYIQPTIDKLKQIQADKNAALEPVRQDIVTQSATDRSAAMAKRDAVEPVDVQPWTQKRPENDPIRTFGSLGSIFAQIASAFTNQPMNNALEGSAAAMNAMRQGDLAAYQDAHQTWKDNTSLALRRHEVQRQDYQDALDLMKTDLSSGQAKLTMLSAKYGDDAVAAMNQAGLYKDMNQVLEARQKSALGLLGVMPRLEQMGMENRMLLADPDWTSGDPERQRQAYQKVKVAMSPYTLAASDPKRIAMQTYMTQHPDATAEDIAAFNRSLTATGAKVSPFDAALNAIRAREGIEAGAETPEMVAEAQKIAKTGGKASATELKQKQAAAEANSIISQLDGLMKQIEANPDVVGTRGKITGAIQSGIGILNPDKEQDTSAAIFKSDMTAIRERISHALTGSKYYSEGRKRDMEKILPGLETLTSSQDAYKALLNVKNQMQGVLTDIGPVASPSAPPKAPQTEPPKTLEDAQTQGYTEQVTSPKTGRVGYRNPQTGKVWVP